VDHLGRLFPWRHALSRPRSTIALPGSQYSIRNGNSRRDLPSSRVEEDLIGYRVLDLGSMWNANYADRRMRFKGTNYDVWV
jgi:hypothetical protein